VLTGIALRLRMTKFSARCIIKRVNFAHKILSISSACLIRIESRMELMDGSMSTFSFSFLLITSGFSSTSFDDAASTSGSGVDEGQCDVSTMLPTCGHLQNLLLCLSTTCELKFSSVIAAVRVDLTQLKYGRSVLDCVQRREVNQTSPASVSLCALLTMAGDV
jgi:hypothetical protein